MSLILKGIDLPKDIDELRLIINGMSIVIEPTQAIQIPIPHGRIIDESDLTDELTELDDLNLESLAPTILEAEE